MILVTGATGQFGHHAIENLIKKGVNPSSIIALVRSEEKGAELKEKGVEIRIGDYTNYDSLTNAFKGVEKLLFVSGSEIETREQEHQNVVNAAKEAGVGHVFYTSFIRTKPASESAIAFLQDTHEKTETWIKESGLNYTILQNALYMDLIPMFVGESVIETGVIKQPADEGKTSSVLREELAEAAAEVLITDGHENKTYPLTNDQLVSYEDIANTIGELSNREITYISPSKEVYQKEMEELGVPAEYIGLFTSFSQAQAKGELDLTDQNLEKFLKRKPTHAKDYLSKIYG